jgi:uncharacterized protein YyaL (SSP411 family)
VLSQAEVARAAALVPLVEGKEAIGGRPTAYVCEQRRCELPTSDPEELRIQVLRTRTLDSP